MSLIIKPRRILSPRQRFAPLISVNQRHPLAQGLVGWWLAEPWMFGGNLWFDMLGRTNGTLIGMAGANSATAGWGATVRPGALGEMRLDGLNKYVDFGTLPFLTAGSPFTLTWWERIAADTLTYPGRFAWVVNGSASKFLVLRVSAAGVGVYRPLAFGLATSSGINVVDAAAPTTASSVGLWRHIAITGTDPTSLTPGNYTVMVNGLPVTPTSAGAVFGAITRTTNAIGDYGGGGVDAALDDVRIYLRVLSPLELVQVYAKPLDGILHPVRRRLFSFAAATGIQPDAASNSGYQTLGTSYSWNHTCAGANRFLAVDVALLSLAGTSVASVTYNGVNLSKIGVEGSGSGVVRTESWGLVAPAAGTNSIVVTFSGSIAAGASAGTAESYTGVQQASPTEEFTGATGTNVGAADALVTVTTVADNDWVHAAIATNDTSITANQTTRNNVTGALGSGANEDTGPKTPPGTQTMGYTNVGALAVWSIGAYGIRPLAASGARIIEPDCLQAQWQTDTPQISRKLFAQPAQARWQADTEILRRTIAARPAQAQWQADITAPFRTLPASPAQSQWQADTPAIHRLLFAQPAQASWQVNTARLVETVAVFTVQSQWQAVTPVAAKGRFVFEALPAQSQWQAVLPEVARLVSAQSPQAQWQAETTSQRFVLAARPAQASWQSSVAGLARRLLALPTQAQWQTVVASPRRTLDALPSQSEWQAVETSMVKGRMLFEALPAQAQWQVDTPATRMSGRQVIATVEAQAQWQVDAPQIARKLFAQPAQAQWQRITATVRFAPALVQAQAQWQVDLPLIRRVVVCQPAQSSCQATAPEITRKLFAQPAQARCQVVVPAVRMKVQAPSTVAMWEVVHPGLRMVVLARSARAKWQVVVPEIAGMVNMVVAAEAAQAQWQVNEPFTRGTFVVSVLPLRPINLTIMRALSAILLQEGR